MERPAGAGGTARADQAIGTTRPPLDPEGGIVGNTNNKLLEAPFPDNLSFTWGDSQRVLRWEFLMQDRELHTRESFVEAQTDIVSTAASAVARNVQVVATGAE